MPFKRFSPPGATKQKEARCSFTCICLSIFGKDGSPRTNTRIKLNGDDDMARASTIAEYEKLRDEAFELARAKGWEGDTRQGPFIAGIPTGDYTTGILIAWKQGNNGITFIASPFKLPWLD